jgi:prepilin-type N-terminal cleavage/methylation domain-containing protein
MKRCRSGFTLIELLVVIAIIAILVAMLLPAVQQVREAARKSQCQDHLHNLGIAVMDYEGTHMVIPPGQLRGYVNPNEWGSGFSWGAMLLPFIEQKPLYDQLVFETAAYTDPNKTTIRSVNGIDLALCPSDSDRPPTRAIHATADANYMSSIPATSYFASTGAFWHWSDSTDRRVANGVFVIDPANKVTISSITDGTSNTIAIGEKAYQVWTGGSFLGVQHATQTPGSGTDAACCQDWYLGMGYIAPNTGYQFGVPTTPGNPRNTGFSSPHAGGVQFVFMDGKVNFISETVDHPRSSQATWAAVGGGCYWVDAAGQCGGAQYDNKAQMANLMGVYQRLHSRNDGLPVKF